MDHSREEQKSRPTRPDETVQREMLAACLGHLPSTNGPEWGLALVDLPEERPGAGLWRRLASKLART
jgi:hypothetical protein